MLKYTKSTLQKIESLFKELDYTVRYEKGNFQSGYCIVENRNMVIVNRFFDTEARINSLLEIWATLEADPRQLSEKGQEVHKKISHSFEWKKEKEENLES